jgi:hypothetical protein
VLATFWLFVLWFLRCIGDARLWRRRRNQPALEWFCGGWRSSSYSAPVSAGGGDGPRKEARRPGPAPHATKRAALVPELADRPARRPRVHAVSTLWVPLHAVSTCTTAVPLGTFVAANPARSRPRMEQTAAQVGWIRLAESSTPIAGRKSWLTGSHMPHQPRSR